MKNKYIILLVLLSTAIASCNKDYNAVEPINENRTIEDLTISSDFNWQTYKTYEVTLKSSLKSQAEIVSDKDVVYQRVFLIENMPYTFQLTVPTYEKSVRILHLGKYTQLQLDSDNLSINLI